MPTFAGFAASWTTDAAGFPSYVITTDGEIADKHERQGDTWYSVKDESAPQGYRRILTIKAGEVLPPAAQWTPPAPAPQPKPTAQPPPPPAAAPTQTPASLPPPENDIDAQARTTERAQAQAAQPRAEAPDDADPFSQVEPDTLTRLHEIGRKAHGEERWRRIGPERILAHSDGRATSSADLSHAEAVRLINELTGAVSKSPAYAG